jgi:hypothetical protein
MTQLPVFSPTDRQEQSEKMTGTIAQRHRRISMGALGYQEIARCRYLNG